MSSTGPTTAYVHPVYKKLVRTVARAFYRGPCPPKEDEQEKTPTSSRSAKYKVDTNGLGIIVLDALISREWVHEEELANHLKLHVKLLRRALRYLEQEQVVAQEHRKENRRNARREALLAQVDDPEVMVQQKAHTHSYCCIDYPRLLDTLQLRLHLLHNQVKSEVDAKEPVQTYQCPSQFCGAAYSSLDAVHLIDFKTGVFKCERCGSELRQVLSGGAMGDEAARRKRVQAMRSIQQRLEVQLKPVMEVLAQAKNLPPPDFGTLSDWAANLAAAQHNKLARANKGGVNGGGGGGGGRLSGGQYELQIDSYNDQTQVEVSLDFGGLSSGLATSRPAAAPPGSGSNGVRAGAKSGPGNKPVMPWMMKSGTRAPGEGPVGGTTTPADVQEAGKDMKADLTERQRYEAFLSQVRSMKQQQLLAQQSAGLVHVKRERGLEDVGGFQEDKAKRVKLEDGMVAVKAEVAVKSEDRFVTTVKHEAVDQGIEWEDTPGGVEGPLEGGLPLEGSSHLEGEEDDFEWEDV